MLFPIVALSKVPVAEKVTESPETIPLKVPEIVAAVVPSYSLLFATTFDNVNCFGETV